MPRLVDVAIAARSHHMEMTWTDSLLDEQYDGAWNKIAYLHSLMRHELRMRQLMATQRRQGKHASDHTESTPGRIEWMLWCDWDLIFTDLAAALPLEECAPNASQPLASDVQRARPPPPLKPTEARVDRTLA